MFKSLGIFLVSLLFFTGCNHDSQESSSTIKANTTTVSINNTRKNIGSYETTGASREVSLSNDGTKAYVAHSNGLIILDITIPSNPVEIGSYVSNANGITLSSDGTKAYIVGGSNGLEIVDITIPSNPVK